MKRSFELGFAASSLLLPGHGGTGEEFARSSRQQWLEYVNAEIARYKKNYNSIILVGHSMGSLLSFLTYMESPEQIIGIVAIDTPLYVRVKGSIRQRRRCIILPYLHRNRIELIQYVLLAVEPSLCVLGCIEIIGFGISLLGRPWQGPLHRALNLSGLLCLRALLIYHGII